MNVTPQAPSDPRGHQDIFLQLRSRASSYVPEALLSDGTAGAALGNVFGYYVEAVLRRLNQAPDKNKLAFLDMLALQLTPARQARAPVVFQLNPKASLGTAPAGTAVAAPPPAGSNSQIVFETEQEVGLTAGRLTEVVSLWPGRDGYIDHSQAFAAGQPMQLFALPKLQPIPHYLYLSHDKLLALAGSVTLSLEVQLQPQPSESKALHIQWEYWDGKVWRGFLLDSQCNGTGTQLPDGTAGFSQSGRIELQADGATSQQTAVNGVTGFWIRGRVTDPLPSGSADVLPEIDSIRLSSLVEQRFRPSLDIGTPQPAPAADSVFATALTQQIGFFILTNAAGQPLGGASLTVHLQGQPLNQTLTLHELSTRPGVFTLPLAQCQLVDSLSALFFGIQIDPAVPIDDTHRPNSSNRLLPVSLKVSALAPDSAYADSTKLDTTKPFYPFGQQPQPGSTFYFSSQETFSKPNAKMRVYLPLTSAPLGDISGNDPNNGRKKLDRQIAWEYWNGRAWAPLTPSSTNQGTLDFSQTEVADFTIPTDMAVTAIAGQAGLWARARLVRGGFGYTQEIKWQAGTTAGTVNTITYVVSQPPVLADIRIAYTWQYGPFPMDRVISYNDFQYKDHTAEALSPGKAFAPYERTSDLTPELYLGFDKKPPAAQLGIFFNIAEQRGDINGPALTWEYWNGFVWSTMPSTDGTGNLRLPGIVALISEDDSALLARFDTPLYWLRGRLKEDGPPGSPVLNGVFPNAVWASQQSTLTDVPVGLSNAAADQSFAIHQIPILENERIEVRELFGPRANVEWRIVALALFNGDENAVRGLEDDLGKEGPAVEVIRGDLRLRRNRLKQVSEVWLRWKSLPTLAGAGPNDRVYAIDRARGILTFGDGANGRIPPQGAAILGRVLRTGGGASGNVAANTIAQILGVVVGVQSASNPVAAEGGSDAETLPDFVLRGPQTLRHRGRAISISDYATLAHEASSAVAFARAIPVHDPGGRTLPGWVTVLILPNSLDPRPWPSFGLREEVRKYLESRAPADMAAGRRIFVTGPDYLSIDVSATIAPLVASQAGDVDAAARAALAAFLHPLFGGPQGNGWDLGRSVFLSDVVAALERVEGLDYVSDLELLVDGQVQGSSVAVGPLQIAVAVAIRITLQRALKESMPIPLPNLDDRRWTDLVDEGRSLIPVYSPEWTDFNPSDPGITLLELFAWVAEMDIYQLNRIPDRHKRKFLELIEIGRSRRVRRESRCHLAWRERDPVAVPAGASVMVSSLAFRTLSPLTAAPGALQALQTAAGATFHDATATFPAEPVWPFGVPPQIDAAIYFGLDQPLPPQSVASLVFHFMRNPSAGGVGGKVHHSAVVAWEYLNSFGWWSPLLVEDSTRSFSADGSVNITGPAQMRQQAMGRVAAPLFYIRARYSGGMYDSPPKLLAASWNAVEAEQSEAVAQHWDIAAGTVASGTAPAPGGLTSVLFGFNASDKIDSIAFDSTADPQFRVLTYTAAGPGAPGAIVLELLLVAAGTGGPGQRTLLAGGSAVVESSVQLYSLEAGAWRNWNSRLTFDSSSAADLHYLLDAQTGDVQFGDGRRGRALPERALLFASYRKTAASLGTVGAGQTASIAATDALAGKFSRIVTALPAAAGADAESLGEAIARAVNEREAPLRAITLADYEALARSTPGVDIARASARANLYPALDSFEALGVVTVIIVPNMPVPMPLPSAGLLSAVRRHLNRRRAIGTRVEVVAPTYLQVAVAATVQSGRGQNQTLLKQAILDALNGFLDPLIGGPDGTGWPFGRDVYETDILRILAQTPGVDHVNIVSLIPTGCPPQCGNICLKPTWLVTPGQHQIEVL